MAKPDFEKVLSWFETASKIKKIMKRKNLMRCRCECPHCEDGMISASLNGYRQHMWAKCSTPNCLRIME